MRVTRLVLAMLAALLALPAIAGAKIIEVGDVGSRPTPSCPDSPCEVISRTTAYQTRIGDNRDFFVVPKDGRIVAWTISLGKPNTRQIDFFDSNYGEASAGLTILRRGKRLFHRVLGQSPIEKLQPYFGQKVQFPLTTSIPVKKGYVVGLTVPTWAPALTQLLDNGSAWRASRAKGKCDNTDTQTAQTRLQQRTQYRCLYRAQLTYSATLITDPKPNKKPKN